MGNVCARFCRWETAMHTPLVQSCSSRNDPTNSLYRACSLRRSPARYRRALCVNGGAIYSVLGFPLLLWPKLRLLTASCQPRVCLRTRKPNRLSFQMPILLSHAPKHPRPLRASRAPSHTQAFCCIQWKSSDCRAQRTFAPRMR